MEFTRVIEFKEIKFIFSQENYAVFFLCSMEKL